MKYDVRDMSLANAGHLKIDWVKDHMPLLSMLEKEFEETKPFAGLKISLSVHLEAKTAYLCKVLKAGGAEMYVTGSNVLSTKDDVCAALVEDGLSVFAYHAATREEYLRHIEMVLECKPNIVIDDGADLVTLLHEKRPDLAVNMYGGCEETTTGLQRLRALDREGKLLFPMMAVNDAKCKHLFDNRYGTGQSTWDAIMRNTNLVIAGKTVVVCGYGWVSKGIAMYAGRLGAQVIVTEIDPVKAIEAKMDGFSVMKMEEAAKYGDIFCTGTGNINTIDVHHMMVMKNGAILTNSGHFNCEINMEGLRNIAVSHHERRPNIEGYVLPNGNIIDVICEGALVNIAGADGHPAEIMDTSFAVQAFGALYLAEHHGELEKHLLDIPDEIDNRIAFKKLQAWGIEIDTLTPEQEEYINSWKL
ncbi:MAG: adenosylhomocysteinase [Clostridia bacterium]|nr:adenosylhomocysteinase [Clostridia bacterium]